MTKHMLSVIATFSVIVIGAFSACSNIPETNRLVELENQIDLPCELTTHTTDSVQSTLRQLLKAHALLPGDSVFVAVLESKLDSLLLTETNEVPGFCVYGRLYLINAMEWFFALYDKPFDRQFAILLDSIECKSPINAEIEYMRAYACEFSPMIIDQVLRGDNTRSLLTCLSILYSCPDVVMEDEIIEGLNCVPQIKFKLLMYLVHRGGLKSARAVFYELGLDEFKKDRRLILADLLLRMPSNRIDGSDLSNFIDSVRADVELIISMHKERAAGVVVKPQLVQKTDSIISGITRVRNIVRPEERGQSFEDVSSDKLIWYFNDLNQRPLTSDTLAFAQKIDRRKAALQLGNRAIKGDSIVWSHQDEIDQIVRWYIVRSAQMSGAGNLNEYGETVTQIHRLGPLAIPEIKRSLKSDDLRIVQVACQRMTELKDAPLVSWFIEQIRQETDVVWKKRWLKVLRTMAYYREPLVENRGVTKEENERISSALIEPVLVEFGQF